MFDELISESFMVGGCYFVCRIVRMNVSLGRAAGQKLERTARSPLMCPGESTAGWAAPGTVL
eukprot:COSAG02_NODE_2314_length_9156_cov_8.075072_8_plen_62_part_00